MVDDRAVRWGICGTGRIANDFVEGLRRVPDAEIVAVASEDPDRARAFAARHGVPRSHVGYPSLAADEDVDVVYVASTQERHVDDTLLMLRGGRHVLCEKPFALDVEDAQAMVGEAQRHGRFLMEAMWSRFLPSYVKLGELLGAGAIGEPRLVEANFSFRVPDDDIAGHRLFDPARGGGALYDLGVYPVQLAHLVLGQPTEVAATARFTDAGVDEQTAMLLGHPGGRAALLHAAIRTIGTNRARITGDEGVIEIDAFMHAARRFTVARGDDVEVFDFPRASLHFQVGEVHRCLRAGRLESSVMPHSATLEILTTLERIRDAIGLVFPERDV